MVLVIVSIVVSVCSVDVCNLMVFKVVDFVEGSFISFKVVVVVRLFKFFVVVLFYVLFFLCFFVFVLFC